MLQWHHANPMSLCGRSAPVAIRFIQTYTLQRTDDYDGFLFLKDFSEVQTRLKRLAEENKPNKYVSEIASFLERSEEYGTHFDRYRM